MTVMASPASTSPIEAMFVHLPVLRNYAKKMIQREEILTENEDWDRLYRLREFRAIGDTLNWTEREVVVLLLRQAFAEL